MKKDLTDTVFLILVRLDSIQRLENTITITSMLVSFFDTKIIVVEADVQNNYILKNLLSKKVEYHFIEDRDPVFYRTKLCNSITKNITARFISIWDADIVPDKKRILESIELLRSDKADVVFPYNGFCLDVSPILRMLFLKSPKISLLKRHKQKMSLLYNYPVVGGAFFIDCEKYFLAGMENENYYGWGNEDFDRFARWKNRGFKITRIDEYLFHLSHPRKDNSGYRSTIHAKMSDSELIKTNSTRLVKSRL